MRVNDVLERAEAFRQKLRAGKCLGQTVLYHPRYAMRPDAVFRVTVGRRAKRWGMDYITITPVDGDGRDVVTPDDLIEDTPEALAAAREDFDMLERYRSLTGGKMERVIGNIRAAVKRIGVRKRKPVYGLMKAAGLLKRDGGPKWRRMNVGQLQRLAKIVVLTEYGHGVGNWTAESLARVNP